MDINCQASVESTSTSSSGTGRDNNSLNLRKLSHKISKAASQSQLRKPCFELDAPPNQNHPQNRLQSATPSVQPQQQQNIQAQPQQQHQPPVYNINKNDFRDVVQKLTGSPAHERFSSPPPVQPPKSQSSRLQRIRPPPLAHVTNRPPQQLPNSFHPLNSGLTGRPMAPLSPLPPLPAVHAPAESPVSAYMRYIQNSIPTADSNQLPPPQGFSPLGPLASSCWNNFTTQQQQGSIPLPPSSAMLQAHPQFQVAPSSPLGFGCLNSPMSSSHGVLLSSPNLMFPATTGQLGFPQLPVSPTVPASSPRWIGD
ncbi:VQ motif-containing protein 9-like [Cucumis melo var. makuwa]|uniref:VQ motif-containing protein 9-like n=2 Tax=Cucumis melo TaxID=3656 RepID=A0A5A7VFN2_CUCMM|nr:VQ motif-containing protein 9-like [Cucumis melo]KAA0065136.1 VQ motif-containing protein 9-like [Cucumis melo var. makuwa]